VIDAFDFEKEVFYISFFAGSRNSRMQVLHHSFFRNARWLIAVGFVGTLVVAVTVQMASPPLMTEVSRFDKTRPMMLIPIPRY
jgi:hypothetical protein